MTVERDVAYLPQVREGDPWVGEKMFAPSEISIPISLAAPTEGEANIRLQHWAASEAPADPDHHLVFTLNDRVIGEDRWDGVGWRETVLTPDWTLLRDGENISHDHSPWRYRRYCRSRLPEFDTVDYWQRLIADADRLELQQ